MAGERCETLSKVIIHELVDAISRSRSSRGRLRNGVTLGSTSRRRTFDVVDLAVPCSPLTTRIGCIASGFSGRGLDVTHAAADLPPTRSRLTWLGVRCP